MFLLISYWTQAPSRVGSHAQTLSRVFQVTDPVPPKAAGRGVWEQFCLWSVGEGGGELKTELTQHPPDARTCLLRFSGIPVSQDLGAAVGHLSRASWHCLAPYLAPLPKAGMMRFNWKRAQPVKLSPRNDVVMETRDSVKAASRKTLKKWEKGVRVYSGFWEDFFPCPAGTGVSIQGPEWCFCTLCGGSPRIEQGLCEVDAG